MNGNIDVEVDGDVIDAGGSGNGALGPETTLMATLVK